MALLTDQGRASRARAAFGDQVLICESPGQLLVRSRESGVDLVLVGVPGTESVLTTAVAAIRASRTSPPVYVFGDRSLECMRLLMPLARAGARGLILRDVDDDVVNLRRLLARGTLADAIETVTIALRQVVSARHLPLFLCCIQQIVEPTTALRVARQLEVSRRTLSAWARQAGARGVRSMTSKCRVLVAIEMIRGSDRSLEHIAHELRFSSSAHLHNTVTRYTGKRPRDAAADDLGTWCRRLFTPLSRRIPPPAEKCRPPAEWSRTPNDAILPPTNQAAALRSPLT